MFWVSVRVRSSCCVVMFDLGVGSGGRIRTCDLRVMSPTSYHCSTPHRFTRSFDVRVEYVIETDSAFSHQPDLADS